ncbi:nuclear transport factor 2 family protein [Streptomyces sp. NPDC086777]|uniref:nuclear transport factor 2 family protein n=1 Tax=Streptomyces sp. NPDC086777 TaxID=3154866 RepID=UPI00344D0995
MPTTLSVTDRNREIVRKIYEAADRGTLDELGAYFSDDYVMTQPTGSPMPGQWSGAEADAAMAKLFESCGFCKITVREVLVEGPHRVMGLVDVEGVAKDGSPWEMPAAELFRIEDGKVTDVRPFYWDLVELRRAAGIE